LSSRAAPGFGIKKTVIPSEAEGSDARLCAALLRHKIPRLSLGMTGFLFWTVVRLHPRSTLSLRSGALRMTKKLDMIIY